MTPSIEIYPWDAADFLETQEDIRAYLEAAFEVGDPELVIAALEDIARSKGMASLIESGLEDKNLSINWPCNGKPELAAVLHLLKVLGLRLHVTPVASLCS